MTKHITFQRLFFPPVPSPPFSYSQVAHSALFPCYGLGSHYPGQLNNYGCVSS